MRANVKSVSSQALSYAEQNVNAAFDFAQKLVQAKDPQEAFALQSEYLKIADRQRCRRRPRRSARSIQSSATPKSE